MQLYAGTVYRNTNFGNNGTIEVMLQQTLKYAGEERNYSNPICEILDDYKEALKMMPSYSNTGKIVQNCLVMSPMGNGYNSGMFQLPQVGTVGLIADIEDPELFHGIMYIWLGGLYGYKEFNQKVKLPNDDTVSDELNYEDRSLTVDEDNGDSIRNSRYITDGQFIVKTKTCDVEDPESITRDDIDWKKIPGENTFVLNKLKAALRHNVYSNKVKNGLGEIIFDDNQILIKRRNKISDSKIRDQNITINDTNIVINNTDGENTTTITIDSGGNLQITTTGNTNISTEGDLKIDTTGDTNISSEGNLNLSAKGMMTIEANGQNLARIINDFAEDVKNLTTQGSPATHATTPASIAMIQNVQTKLGTGYNK